MGCDLYFISKRLDNFKKLCDIYLEIKPVFDVITACKGWEEEGVPEDNRLIFLKITDTLSYGQEFGLPAPGPGEDAGAIFLELIVLGFAKSSNMYKNKDFYVFTRNDSFKLEWEPIRRWQYADYFMEMN